LSNYEYKNKTLLVPITVQGRKDGPYILMSLPSEGPNLHAVNVEDAYNATKIFCFHYNQTNFQGTNNLRNKNLKNNVKKEENSNVESSLTMFEKDFNAFI
jgi:hypothetical protein